MLERIFGVLAAALLVLVGLAVTPAGALAVETDRVGSESSVEAIAPEVAPADIEAAQSCNSGDFCFWNGTNYSGARGRVAGNNPNWAAFPQSSCPGGNWDNCASSAYNNGTQCTVWAWPLSNYNGAVRLRFDRGDRSANLGNVGGGWNNRISSNHWCTPS